MRIKFGKSIRFCTVVTHPKDSKLLLFTNDNGVYTVDMKTIDNAERVFKSILIDGCYDVSDYEYSN